MKAVEVKNLSYAYIENQDVLKNVSFSLEKGASLSIVGENGSGKSTLVKLLVGLLHSSRGEILINDNPLKLGKNSISIVFQNPDNQFIATTVEDDIAFGLENYCVPPNEMKDIIIKYAAMVGMDKYLSRAPETLSGGQKQRVAIAGVLALNSDIIIFDEATSMLDPEGKKDFYKTLTKLRKEKPELTTIFITHDEEEVFMSDYIMVLNQGEIKMFGSNLDIYNQREEYQKYGLKLPFLFRLEDALKKVGLDVGHNSSLKEIKEKLHDIL